MSSKFHLVLWLGVAFSSLFLRIENSRADIVISTFEEADLALKLDAQTYRGQTAPGGAPVPSTFRSGAVTFENYGAGFEMFGDFRYEYWTGIGFARRAAPATGSQLYEQGNDLIAKPGIGASGSQTWAVAYESGILTADAGYRFNGLDLTNTLYTWTSINDGDPFSPKFGASDFFTVRFTNTDTAGVKDFDLANFRTGNSLVLDQWQHVDLADLQASRLSVSFLGSRANAFGLTTPTYLALDNVAVAAVPEPSSLVLLGFGGAIIAWHRRRRPRAQIQAL